MKIGILGVRGVPVNYGGFEPLAEKLSIYLVERGHEVVVYGDVRYCGESTPYQGVQRRNFRSLPSKSLEKLTCATRQAFDACFQGFDKILMLGLSPIIASWMPRLRGCELIANVDGLEWQRRKWGPIGSFYLRESEWIATRLCKHLIADSYGIVDYYQKTYKCDTVYIPYGAEVDYPRPSDKHFLARYGLKSRKYLLQICRLEPENNALWSINAYRSVKSDLPLVIVGDAPYADDYQAELERAADHRVRFTGRLDQEKLAILRRGALIYIHGHEVGGTNPSLLEAMASGNCVVAIDVVFNRETLGRTGLIASPSSRALTSILQQLVDSPSKADRYREAARRRIYTDFSWDSVLEAYHQLIVEGRVGQYQRSGERPMLVKRS